MTVATTAAATAPVPVEPADAVASAVLAVPGVVRLDAGRFGEVGTYLPGRRLPGVRLAQPGEDRLSAVHVVVDASAPVVLTAAAVHRAAEAVLGAPVDVVVADLDDAPPPALPPAPDHP